MPVQRLTIFGAGTMGCGIAEVAATCGLNVTVVDKAADQLERARTRLQQSLEKAARRNRFTEPVADVAARIQWAGDLTEVTSSEFIIEAISEREDWKRALFLELDRWAGPATILASNTSSISITRIGSWTSRPQQVVGLHFFNPVPIMTPVEIVTGLHTSPETLEAARALAVQLGKQPLVVHDSPGFVVNRVLMPMINEAIYALQEGVATAEVIDSLMKLGCNHPLGPLALADLIGLDVCLHILRVLQQETGDPKFRPCPLLIRMVDAGQLGRKTGQGFFSYQESPR